MYNTYNIIYNIYLDNKKRESAMAGMARVAKIH